jgi:glycosyltransferase involved in cell wall biosynthesis
VTARRGCLLSVAICTFNRAGLLDDALRSFAATDRPSGVPFELIVVDNNSSDATRAVVERWTARSTFPLRYVFESQQGLSVARNRAVQEAAGHWIWYVDDDVYFSPTWLHGVFGSMTLFPGASALAGSVVVAFEPAQPSWLPLSVLPYYGMTSFGDSPRWLEPLEYPVGANVGFRRAVFDEIGQFRKDLGRHAYSLRSHEEVDLVDRLRARGHKIAYGPAAGVRHRVRGDRATMAWLRRRAYWGGICDGLTDAAARTATRLELIRTAGRTIRTVGRDVLRKGLGPHHQIDYAWRLGRAHQCLAEAARRDRSRTGRPRP